MVEANGSPPRELPQQGSAPGTPIQGRHTIAHDKFSSISMSGSVGCGPLVMERSLPPSAGNSPMNPASSSIGSGISHSSLPRIPVSGNGATIMNSMGNMNMLPLNGGVPLQHSVHGHSGGPVSANTGMSFGSSVARATVPDANSTQSSIRSSIVEFDPMRGDSQNRDAVDLMQTIPATPALGLNQPTANTLVDVTPTSSQDSPPEAIGFQHNQGPLFGNPGISGMRDIQQPALQDVSLTGAGNIHQQMFLATQTRPTVQAPIASGSDHHITQQWQQLDPYKALDDAQRASNLSQAASIAMTPPDPFDDLVRRSSGR